MWCEETRVEETCAASPDRAQEGFKIPESSSPRRWGRTGNACALARGKWAASQHALGLCGVERRKTLSTQLRVTQTWGRSLDTPPSFLQSKNGEEAWKRERELSREALQSGREMTEQALGPKLGRWTGCGTLHQRWAQPQEHGRGTAHFHPDTGAPCQAGGRLAGWY